jgi:hypothetical protein
MNDLGDFSFVRGIIINLLKTRSGLDMCIASLARGSLFDCLELSVVYVITIRNFGWFTMSFADFLNLGANQRMRRQRAVVPSLHSCLVPAARRGHGIASQQRRRAPRFKRLMRSLATRIFSILIAFVN